MFLARFSPLYAINPTIKPYGILKDYGDYGFAAAMELLWLIWLYGYEFAAAILAMAVMGSLRPFWPSGYRITFGHGGYGFAVAILAILAMESLRLWSYFWPWR